MADVKAVMAYDVGVEKARRMTIEDIKNSIDEIDAIKFGKYRQLREQKILYTTKENPYTYTYPANFDAGHPMKCLHIDEEYYIENKQEIDALILCIVAQKTKEIKILEIPLITEDLLNIILSNHNLEEVTLGNKDNPFMLDVELYNKFKKSSIKSVYTNNVAEELKGVLDNLIGYSYHGSLIDNYSLYRLTEEESLSFDKPLSTQELNYLKYINDTCEVSIKIDDEENVLNIIKKLKEYNKNNFIKIYLPAHNKFIKALFENYEYLLDMNITVVIDLYGHRNVLDIRDYISYESRLLKMVEPALNLSPFEKYLFAYNVVKKYKEYREEPAGRNRESRNVYEILDNDYMVCAGFSNLLRNLLDKLGICSRNHGVDVDITFDDVSLDTHIVTEEMLTPWEDGGHARIQVHLIDPKYGIDGIFFADPTWDNDMENDAYNHALMTPDEYNGIARYTYLSWNDVDELFFIHSLEEFYEKTNLWLDKQENFYDALIDKWIDAIKELEPIFYQKICEKYPKITETYYSFTKEEFSELMFILGNYIVSKVNKPITGLQFREAIEVLYEKCYGVTDKEELDKKIDEVMEYNKTRQDKMFPLRYKQDLEGNKIPYLNTVNKFDIKNIEKEYGKSI